MVKRNTDARIPSGSGRGVQPDGVHRRFSWYVQDPEDLRSDPSHDAEEITKGERGAADAMMCCDVDDCWYDFITISVNVPVIICCGVSRCLRLCSCEMHSDVHAFVIGCDPRSVCPRSTPPIAAPSSAGVHRRFSR